MVESLVVFVLLAIVTIFAGNTLVEWIGTFAVLFTFKHVSVANRLEEREALRVKHTGKPEIECYKRLTQYLVTKEILWFAYFILLGAYSALVGVFVFLLYPVWRKWYRKKYPLDRNKKTA